MLRKKCLYVYVFETPSPEDENKAGRYKDAPQPFIIEPPLETRTDYKEGESLPFNLVLVGKAMEYLPYFVYAFEDQGRRGIGKDFGRYLLEEVRAFSLDEQPGESVYSAGDRKLAVTNRMVTFKDVEDKSGALGEVSRFTIKLLTPTRLKHEGHFVEVPEFRILITNLMRRLSLLASFHCGGGEIKGYKELLEQAKNISIESRHTTWVDWERYSSRQDTRMKMGGIIGHAVYVGNLTPFLPYLLLGQHLHVGKGATFGLGKYTAVHGRC